jgi:GGDEF domain-containing protein
MTTESLGDVLSVMLRDHIRIEAGMADLQQWLTQGGPAGQVEVAVLDLDGSAAVRARGLAAKRHLVGQFQHLIRTIAPPGAIVLDSGTRDEMIVVHRGGGLLAAADHMRSRVRQADFTLPDGEGVRLTTSVGFVTVPAARSAEQLAALARAGLTRAKALRDCVCVAPPDTAISVDVAVPAGLLADGTAIGDLASRGIRTIREKHGPMWYWVAEQGRADRGIIPCLDYTVDPASAGTAAVRFFELLIAQISMEAAVAAVEAAGTRLAFRAALSPDPPGDAELAAQYLPGEWIGAFLVAAPWRAGDTFARIQQARQTAARAMRDTVVRPVPLQPGDVAALTRIGVRRGRTAGDLLAEALQLEADRALAGGQSPPRAS